MTVDELMRHLLELQPTILYFSGHGRGQGTRSGRRHEGMRATRDISSDDPAPGVLFQGDDGRPQPVTPTALTKMIKSTASTVRLAVLNACYADALRDVVGCAIDMKGTISDDAARSFAVGFYRAVGHRRPVGNAYAQAEATLAVVRHFFGAIDSAADVEARARKKAAALLEDAWAKSYTELKVGPVDPCHQDDTRGGSRVVRGGSWFSVPRALRSASRCRFHRQARDRYLGFRVVWGGSRQPDAH